MNFDAIKTISQAESRAENIRAEAASEAKRILASAEADGAALIKSAEERAHAHVLELYAEADRAGTAEALKIENTAKDEAESLEKIGEAAMDKAVSVIVERIYSWQ
jgi:V/A-type H+-transporting ATPase subunit G/H